ncbi:MAG: RND transporter, partial [Aliifodinibius sp.]|nr:RND transporter [Fodinibius sp.]NIY30224.1 RND transporter [Fodinibius sp.]
MIIVVVSIVGIAQIQINDNPVRWFRSDHHIRVADRVLNRHFGGTYNAYLVLSKSPESGKLREINNKITAHLMEAKAGNGVTLLSDWEELYGRAESLPLNESLNQLIESVYDKLFEANDEESEIWEEILAILEEAQKESKYFQKPEALHYIERIQSNLSQSDLVGKSNSVVDIVKTVHRELREGDPEYFTIPGNS